MIPRRRLRGLSTLLVLLAAALVCVPAQTKKGDRRLLDVAAPGVRNDLEYGGHGLLVLDAQPGHRHARRIPMSGLTAYGKPDNVKETCVGAATRRLEPSTIRSIAGMDFETETIVWGRGYAGGCDHPAIAPDGRTLDVPSFEKDQGKVLDAASGEEIARIRPNSGAYGTIYGPDGRHAYPAGLRSPLLSVADTSTHGASGAVGPFASRIRPFTTEGRRSLCFVCVEEEDLLGFAVGDLGTGRKPYRVEVPGVSEGPVKRHGCPGHGVAPAADETEVWVADTSNRKLHVFDVTYLPPSHRKSITLRDGPSWITSSLRGDYADPSTVEVVDRASQRIVATPTDERGAAVRSGKMVQVDIDARGVLRAGDQFGIGRVRP